MSYHLLSDTPFKNRTDRSKDENRQGQQHIIVLNIAGNHTIVNIEVRFLLNPNHLIVKRSSIMNMI
jgi:hypothetical protein